MGGYSVETIIFDVDDTLYDQRLPFERAFSEVFELNLSKETLSNIYIASRKHSDDLFEKEQAGEISTIELQTYRITEACRDYEIEISYQQAVDFQKIYLHEQEQMTLFPEVKVLLDFLHNQGNELAVLTNGSTHHQSMKINQLGLQRWIKPENCFISGSIGHAKPKRKAFEHVEQHLQLNPKNTLYIGDAFINDVVGAKNAGWQVIWFNHRLRKPEDPDVVPNFTAHTPKELLDYFKRL